MAARISNASCTHTDRREADLGLREKQPNPVSGQDGVKVRSYVQRCVPCGSETAGWYGSEMGGWYEEYTILTHNVPKNAQEDESLRMEHLTTTKIIVKAHIS